MNKEEITRTHSNGITASISRDGAGGYIASAMNYAPGPVTSNPVETGIEDLNSAKKAADRLAHHGCDGSCPQWPEADPWSAPST